MKNLQGLKTLLKKGIKAKHLSFDGDIDLGRGQPLGISENVSRVKRLTKSCCKSLSSLSVRLTCQEDILSLSKIQGHMRDLQKLQIDETAIGTPIAQKALQRFLMRSKCLKSFQNSPKPRYLQRNELPKEERICFMFHLKEDCSEKKKKTA